MLEYERNLDAIVDRSESLRVRPIFLTQPVLWKVSGMRADEEATLMFGYVGRSQEDATTWYSASALATGMAQFNDVMRSVCHTKRIECVDLAADLPSDLTVFYDDCHFNITGAEQVAERVGAFLLKRPPFVKQPPGVVQGKS